MGHEESPRHPKLIGNAGPYTRPGKGSYNIDPIQKAIERFLNKLSIEELRLVKGFKKMVFFIPSRLKKVCPFLVWIVLMNILFLPGTFGLQGEVYQTISYGTDKAGATSFTLQTDPATTKVVLQNIATDDEASLSVGGTEVYNDFGSCGSCGAQCIARARPNTDITHLVNIGSTTELVFSAINKCGSGVGGDFVLNITKVPCIPSLEVCDGLDNNCDGNIDEGVCSPDYSKTECEASYLSWLPGAPDTDSGANNFCCENSAEDCGGIKSSPDANIQTKYLCFNQSGNQGQRTNLCLRRL